ncbi:sensor histidine kinase [Clostridium thermopalmarium]|uniref:sensor histidine kinase n=1 Tax=Clostridium thermopalmarium TaxID=29373 RepID=UPI001A9A3BE4|nr:sensor histidine kinase [Clostridium thermopalmarium]
MHNERKDYQDFIISWIHEVKLPITASRMLMKNSTVKTLDYIVDKLEDELNKVDNYVEQALYYSRIGSFSNDYFITEVSLNQIVKESVKKYSKLFIQKRIRLTMLDEEQFVYSDSKWLGFVIDQIVANSLKYTDDGGAISFTFESNSREKQLLIKDTGIGIKPEDINRVFEKGFTGSLQRNHSKSTGIGLYLAKQIALKLGHNLSIQSEEDKYTQVTIHFPKISSYYYL